VHILFDTFNVLLCIYHDKNYKISNYIRKITTSFSIAKDVMLKYFIKN